MARQWAEETIGGPHDQAAVLELLASPDTHGGAEVETIETHAAVVFLAGDRAYKLKRAVKYPYLDYSTPENRHRMCIEEVRINRRTAPELYLGVAPVERDRDGALRLGEVLAELRDGGEPSPKGSHAPGRRDREGGKRDFHSEAVGEASSTSSTKAVDWLVVMRRFDQDLMFDRMAARGALDARMADGLADAVAHFHLHAELKVDERLDESTAGVALESIAEMAAQPVVFEPDGPVSLERETRAQLARLKEVLRRRGASGTGGAVRACHGDLHLRNIVLWRGKPLLFDAIEFEPAFRDIDVLYDLAFLLMDMDNQGVGELANRVLNRYLARLDDYSGLETLPLYLSMRAAVRAKVAASLSALHPDDNAGTEARSEARKYLSSAARYLVAPLPRLVAVAGPSGTGKTTLSAGLGPALEPFPGAVVLRSDVLRKTLLGVEPEERLPASQYVRKRRDTTYRELFARAAEVLRGGRTAIVDAVLGNVEQRSGLAALAREAGVPFIGLWLTASPEALRRRVAQRTGDASDAGEAVVESQLRHLAPRLLSHGPAEPGWHRLDAGAEPDDVRATALDYLTDGGKATS